MCTNCRLTTPNGPHEVCHACAVAVRSEVRRGLDAIEEYLDGRSRSELERRLTEEEE